MDKPTADQLNSVSGQVVDSAMEVHSALGPGLLESAYEACLKYELRLRGLDVQSQQALPVVYKEVRVDLGYRIDLLVAQGVVVELKAVDKLLPVHEAQLLSYLKLSGHRLGLLINFHVSHLKDGIKRMVNHLQIQRHTAEDAKVRQGHKDTSLRVVLSALCGPLRSLRLAVFRSVGRLGQSKCRDTLRGASE